MVDGGEVLGGVLGCVLRGWDDEVGDGCVDKGGDGGYRFKLDAGVEGRKGDSGGDGSRVNGREVLGGVVRG